MSRTKKAFLITEQLACQRITLEETEKIMLESGRLNTDDKITEASVKAISDLLCIQMHYATKKAKMAISSLNAKELKLALYGNT